MDIIYTVPRIPLDPTVRFPSSWKQAIGKPLTDRRIAQLMKEGRYGPQYLPHDNPPCTGPLCVKSNKPSRKTAFLRYAYMPKAMWCCPACRAAFREEHDKKHQSQVKHHRSINEILLEYV